MEWFPVIIGLVSLGLLAFLGGRYSLRSELGSVRQERDTLRQRHAEAEIRREVEGAAAAARLEELKELRGRFETTFKALSSEALSRNNRQFLDLAEETFTRLQEGARGELKQREKAIDELVVPLRKSLEEVDEKIHLLEKARIGAYTGLEEQIRNLLESQGRLESETSNLVFALKAPNVRGRWGEVQLKRTVEFAGMVEHVDFLQQQSVEGDNGRQRPDLVVKLPGGKTIVVDAKAPLDGYLKALESKDGEERVRQLQRHARQIREHVKGLGGKQYWKQFEPSPEFVVLFLPGEAFFSAALEQDPDLIQYGTGFNVLLATPTTLIALLKATAYGWRQEAIADEAKEISAVGRELYERLTTQTEHFADVGKALKRAVDSYNKSLRSMETRVLVTARKFERLSAEGSKSLPDLESIESNPLERAD